ncbi:MAG TPA: acyl-CoA synthetase [Rhodospirillales bacterium]
MARARSPATEMQAPATPARDLRKVVWFLLILVSMLVMSLPTVVLLLFGMLPTIVAWVIDRTEQKYATFCVCGMNFSGLFPFMSDVWFKEHTTDHAVRILTNMVDLMVIYGAAAFGWMMFKTVPPVITQFLSVMLQRRVAVLREQQKTIMEEWGEGVTILVDGVQQAQPEAKPKRGRGRG